MTLTLNLRPGNDSLRRVAARRLNLATASVEIETWNRSRVILQLREGHRHVDLSAVLREAALQHTIALEVLAIEVVTQ
jgi:hypothetical protein